MIHGRSLAIDWPCQEWKFPKRLTAGTSLTGSSETPAAVFVQLEKLCLNNARRNEEDELLIRGAHAAPFEQIAEGWNVAQQRHLRDVD